MNLFIRFLGTGFDFSLWNETVFQALASTSVRKLKTVELTVPNRLSLKSNLNL